MQTTAAPPREIHLPDFNFAGLSVDDLIDVLNFVKPLTDQFDTALPSFGRPFTAKSISYPGCIEDTQIGEVVSSIQAWAVRQERRIIERLTVVSTADQTADEHDYRAATLMADVLRGGDWSQAKTLFERLAIEAATIQVGGARGSAH